MGGLGWYEDATAVVETRTRVSACQEIWGGSKWCEMMRPRSWWHEEGLLVVENIQVGVRGHDRGCAGMNEVSGVENDVMDRSDMR